MSNSHHSFGLLFFLAFAVSVPCGLGQGPLTPPGAPAPTMKSLAQIEARTAIDPSQPGFALPYTINQAGSYYLTGNLTVSTGNAIVIASDNVTLDLNGFTISSTAAAANGVGILLGGAGSRSHIHIFNGHIKGGVTYNGVVFTGGGFNEGIGILANCSNARVWSVSVSRCLGNGIYLGPGSVVVESCTVDTVGGYGISGETVSHCTVYTAGLSGLIGRTVSDCTGASVASGDGIFAQTATNCVGYSESGSGVFANSAANDCYGQSQSGIGVYVLRTANNCHGYSNTSNGLNAAVATGCNGYSYANRGISAEVVTSCYGVSATGGSYGIFATHIASNSYGLGASGIGLNAYIATSCRGLNSGGYSVGASFKYNMP